MRLVFRAFKKKKRFFLYTIFLHHHHLSVVVVVQIICNICLVAESFNAVFPHTREKKKAERKRDETVSSLSRVPRRQFLNWCHRIHTLLTSEIHTDFSSLALPTQDVILSNERSLWSAARKVVLFHVNFVGPRNSRPKRDRDPLELIRNRNNNHNEVERNNREKNVYINYVRDWLLNQTERCNDDDNGENGQGEEKLLNKRGKLKSFFAQAYNEIIKNRETTSSIWNKGSRTRVERWIDFFYLLFAQKKISLIIWTFYKHHFSYSKNLNFPVPRHTFSPNRANTICVSEISWWSSPDFQYLF